jgi:hypothetical protein
MADRDLTFNIAVTDRMSDKLAQAPDRFISITRARCIARYRMGTIPGRPEELIANGEVRAVGKRTISLAYAGGEMRIRKHGGPSNRDWVEVRDFRLRDGWLDQVYEFLDDWLGYVSPSAIPHPMDSFPTVRPRPIQDNPQA